MTVSINKIVYPDGITHVLVFTTNIDKGANTDPITYRFPPNVKSIDILLVGGGGSGGGIYYGAGGGAGGFVEINNVSIDNGRLYTISVGTGGLRNAGGGKGTNGGDSSIVGPLVNLIAYGGGAGGSNSIAGSPGGCGGGGSGGKGGGVGSQGGNGGGSNVKGTTGGGGGGCGGNGVSGTSDYNQAFGGPGKVSSITGESITYGIGGRGGYSPGNDTYDNFGHGGESNTNGTAHNGGNGTVIVRYVAGKMKVRERQSLVNGSGNLLVMEVQT